MSKFHGTTTGLTLPSIGFRIIPGVSFLHVRPPKISHFKETFLEVNFSPKLSRPNIFLSYHLIMIFLVISFNQVIFYAPRLLSQATFCKSTAYPCFLKPLCCRIIIQLP
jgi:hypothetical protein